MKKQGSGWKGESRRHSLARKGVKTNLPDGRRFDVSKFVANGKGRRYKGEPNREWDLAIWFEDLPRNADEQEKEIREWFKLLGKETGLDFDDLVNSSYKKAKTEDFDYWKNNPIDNMFNIAEDMLINAGHSVYQSDSRLLVFFGKQKGDK